MSDMEQFQIVVSEIQSVRQQMASLNAQILELKATTDAVSNQPEDLALHQQLGGVLIEVADRKALIKSLGITLTGIKTLRSFAYSANSLPSPLWTLVTTGGL